MSWELIASTAGGAAATVLGVLIGGFVGRRSQDRHWVRDRQAATYATALDAYVRVEFELRAAYHRGEPPTAVDWSAWGSAITSLSLIAPRDVADTAAELAETLVRVDRYLHGDRTDAAKWVRLRDDLVGAQLALVNAARRSLDPTQAPLRRQLADRRPCTTTTDPDQRCGPIVRTVMMAISVPSRVSFGPYVQ